MDKKHPKGKAENPPEKADTASPLAAIWDRVAAQYGTDREEVLSCVEKLIAEYDKDGQRHCTPDELLLSGIRQELKKRKK